MRLTLVAKDNFDEIKKKVLKYSNGDIILKFKAYGTEGLVVITPYTVYNFINDKQEKNVYIHIFTSRKMLFDALEQLRDVYKINIYDYTVEVIREVGI